MSNTKLPTDVIPVTGATDLLVDQLEADPEKGGVANRWLMSFTSFDSTYLAFAVP